jgi:hypothetical protein
MNDLNLYNGLLLLMFKIIFVNEICTAQQQGSYD